MPPIALWQRGLELFFALVMNDTRLAYALRIVLVARLADTGAGAFLARQILHFAAAVHLEVVGFLRVEIHRKMPIIRAAAFCQHNVVAHLLGYLVVPHKVHPYHTKAVLVHKAHILTGIFVQVLVDDGTATFLIRMVTVEISYLLLHYLLSHSDIGIGGSEAALFIFYGDIHLPILMESKAVVVATEYFGTLPHLFGVHTILRLHSHAAQQERYQYNKCYAFHDNVCCAQTCATLSYREP